MIKNCVCVVGGEALRGTQTILPKSLYIQACASKQNESWTVGVDQVEIQQNCYKHAGGKPQPDACGAPLQAWQFIISPLSTLTFTQYYSHLKETEVTKERTANTLIERLIPIFHRF